MAKVRMWLARGAFAIGATAAATAAIATASSILATPQPLASALEGEGRIYRWRHGDIFYKVRGPALAQPLLLLHSINGGPSSWEVRKAFAALSQFYRVYAPDLLGFGLSDRPALPYTADLYCDLIRDFVRDEIGTATAVIALSLSAAFVIRDAARYPDLFDRLVLVSPTDLHPSRERSGLRRRIDALLGIDWLGQMVYALITTRPAIRFFLRSQAYYHPDAVDDVMIEQYYASAHQRGAHHAPLAFLTGKLSLDIAADWATLRQPVLLVWGQEATVTPLHEADALLRLNPDAELQVIADAGLAVQDERPEEFNRVVEAWLNATSQKLVASTERPQAAEPAILPAERLSLSPQVELVSSSSTMAPAAPDTAELSSSVAASEEETGHLKEEQFAKFAKEPPVAAEPVEVASASMPSSDLAPDEEPTQQLPAVRPSARRSGNTQFKQPDRGAESGVSQTSVSKDSHAPAKAPSTSRQRRSRKSKK